VEGVKSPQKRDGAARGTLKWVGEQYLRSAKFHRRSEVSKRMLRLEMGWLFDAAGDLPIDRFQVRHVEAVMARKAGPAAANKVKKNLSLLFNYAVKKGYGLTFNPARYADKWKENPDGFHTWSEAEIQAFKMHDA